MLMSGEMLSTPLDGNFLQEQYCTTSQAIKHAYNSFLLANPGLIAGRLSYWDEVQGYLALLSNRLIDKGVSGWFYSPLFFLFLPFFLPSLPLHSDFAVILLVSGIRDRADVLAVIHCSVISAVKVIGIA